MKSEQYIKKKLAEWTEDDREEFRIAYHEGDWDVVYSMTEDLTGSAYIRQQILAELAAQAVPLSVEGLTELEEIVRREHKLANHVRVLLAWCDQFLIGNKHLIGSICKQSDDLSFKHAISEANKTLKESDNARFDTKS